MNKPLAAAVALGPFAPLAIAAAPAALVEGVGIAIQAAAIRYATAALTGGIITGSAYTFRKVGRDFRRARRAIRHVTA